MRRLIALALVCALGGCVDYLDPGEHGVMRYFGEVRGDAPLALLPPIADRDGNVYVLYGARDLSTALVFVGHAGGGWTSGCTAHKGDSRGAQPSSTRTLSPGSTVTSRHRTARTPAGRGRSCDTAVRSVSSSELLRPYSRAWISAKGIFCAWRALIATSCSTWRLLYRASRSTIDGRSTSPRVP